MNSLANNASDIISIHQVARFESSQVLPTKAALQHHSLSPRQKHTPSIQRDVAQVLSEAASLIRPEAIWKKMNLDRSDLALLTNLPSRLLARVERSFGIVCTIGPELEARAHQYFNDHQYTRGYLLDQIGTLAVARVARQCAKLLRDQNNTLRWAPGDLSDDHSLNGQVTIFDQVPARHIGVQLNAHNVMTPSKSLTFILLAGSMIKHSPCLIPCDRCVWNGNCDEMDEFDHSSIKRGSLHR